ncbi:MAG: acetylglutamate kinase [Bryobacteraceae bacterium]|nr:acetylglutamate kinase [Bryobacteraceae bacterium]
MKQVIKLGGTLLDHEDTRLRLAAVLAREDARETVVVHGGGKQMTRFLEERGIASTFIGGLRVTTPEVADAVLKVVAGSVNSRLVADLNAAGAEAVGLSGVDAGLVQASRWSEELGQTGRPEATRPRLLLTLTSAGFLPVVACVATNARGDIYNVNADQLAVSVAAGYGARRLVFLTDVDAVLDGDGRRVSHLNAVNCRGLIDTGVAKGGMHAKLEACLAGLTAGLTEIWIGPGAHVQNSEDWKGTRTFGTTISNA